MKNRTTREAEKKTAQINNALGVFIAAFGLIVLVAMYFTETYVQMMTDLVAGLLFLLIGTAMILKAQKTLKKSRTADED